MIKQRKYIGTTDPKEVEFTTNNYREAKKKV